MVDASWQQWIGGAWPQLTQGVGLDVPGYLPHPRDAGFERPPLAEPEGQIDDWVVSAVDGSRVHVHEMPDGRLVAHRDPTDPKRGPLEAVWHWLTESKSGKVVSTLGLIAIVGKLASGSKRKRSKR